MRRIRRCSECGKKLGSTLGKCHECGGENYRAGDTTMYSQAYYWKVWLFGVPISMVERAHEESRERRAEALKNSPRT